MSNPVISIITPTFNSKETVIRALESVSAQTNSSFEHIVVDGGSTDGTIELLKKHAEKHPLRWVSEKDNGIADAMNKGFRMANGAIVAWLDADNRYEPGIFAKVEKAFAEQKDLDILYGNTEVIGRGKSQKYVPPKNISFRTALMKTTGGFPLQPGVFFKKEIFTRANGFDTKVRVAVDMDFWMRVLKAGPKLQYLNENFGYYYRASTANSQSLRGFIGGYKEVYKIADNYGQPILGKILLTWKYSLGLANLIRRRIFT